MADWLKPIRHAAARLSDALNPAPMLISAPISPAVPEAKPKAEPRRQSPDTSAYGPTGTPIVSGFVTDLQEYNPDLRGREALPIYEQMRRSDGDVGAGLRAIKLPIRGTEFQIVPGVKENEPDYALAKEIAKFVEENLFGGLEYQNASGDTFTQGFESVIQNDLLCVDYGCSGSEDLWTVDQDHVRLRRIAPRLPLTFYRFLIDQDGETLEAVEQWGYRGDQFVTVRVPANKFTLLSLQQEGANFYGISMLRTAYQHWYMKQALYRIDAIACERNGAGIPFIEMGLNPAEQDRNLALSWVTSIAANENSGMVLPNGWKFSLQGVTGTEHKLDPSIQHHSEMIGKSMLEMFMSLGSSATGSRALGNSFIDFFQMSEEATARFICESRNQTSIRRLVDFNFGDSKKKVPYPKLTHGSIAVLNPLELFSAFKDIASANVDLIQPDDETENWVRRKVGMPLKSKQVRPRYMPVTQKIQSDTTESPEQIEQDKAKPDAEGDIVKQPKRTQFAESRLRRDILPHEQHHDFEGHADRQDKTQTAIRRILGSAKPKLVRDVAARASDMTPQSIGSLSLPFGHALSQRIAKSAAIAHQYGYDQVYAERYRATKRPKTARVMLSRTLEGRRKWHGLDISIENDVGSVRKGDGWEVRMKNPYGYIRRTEAADGDHVDCYMGTDPQANFVYVVHQKDPNTGTYDEDKCFLDFPSPDAAMDAYKAHRTDRLDAFQSMTTLRVSEFIQKVKDTFENPQKITATERIRLSSPAQAVPGASADEDKPGLIAEASISDLNNALTSRAKSAHIDGYKRGLRDQDLENSILDDLQDGSDAYLDRIAAEAARSAVAGGRYTALAELASEIAKYVRSEAMDQNTCGPCQDGDGDEWESLDEVDWSPGDDCDGADACRGQLLPIFADEGAVQLG